MLHTDALSPNEAPFQEMKVLPLRPHHSTLVSCYFSPNVFPLQGTTMAAYDRDAIFSSELI